MPLSGRGEEIKGEFEKQYPGRGEEVFYRTLRSGGLPASLEHTDTGALFPAELSVRKQEEEDAGALLAASGSPGGPIGGGRRDHGWTGGGPFGAHDWKETYTLENSSDDEYAMPGAGQQPQPQQQATPAPTGDQPEIQELREEEREHEGETDCADEGERIGVLPGGLPEGTLEHPQEWPGGSAPSAAYRDQVGGIRTWGSAGDPPPPRTSPNQPYGGSSPLHPPYGVAGDAVVGYGGIAGGVFKQDWGDAPHPFADQIPTGMSPNEIANWGREHYWRQWER